MMKLNQLVDEAKRLAKPSFWLLPTEDPEEHAATWGGYGPALGPPSEIPHLVTTSLSPLQGTFKAGSCISVYNDTNELAGYCLAHDVRLPLSGTSLAAHPRTSLPPLEALFLFGSKAIQDWLGENKWEPDWGYNSNFPDSAVAEAYEREYQGQHPLYSESAPVVLGGWHFPWPAGDWYDLLEDRLILTTYWESEPWVEVWQQGSEFKVFNRLT